MRSLVGIFGALMIAVAAPVATVSAQVPIKPEKHGSTLKDYEIALEEMVAGLPSIDSSDPYGGVDAIRRAGIDHLRMLALARRDGIPPDTLLFGSDADALAQRLLGFVAIGEPASPTNHPMNAELVLEIVNQRLTHGTADQLHLRETVSLAAYALSALGRHSQLADYVVRAGIDLEEVARDKTYEGGLVFNAIEAFLLAGATDRAVALSQLQMRRLDDLEDRQAMSFLYNHGEVLRRAGRTKDAADAFAKLAERAGSDVEIKGRALEWRAEALVEGGDYRAAERAVRAHQNHVDANLPALQAASAEADKTKPDYDLRYSVQSLTEQRERVYVLRAKALLGQGKDRDLRALLEELYTSEQAEQPASGIGLPRPKPSRVVANLIAEELYKEKRWDELEELVARYAEVYGNPVRHTYNYVPDWLGVADARIAIAGRGLDPKWLEYGMSHAAEDRDRARYDEIVSLYSQLPGRAWSDEQLAERVRSDERNGEFLPERTIANDPRAARATTKFMRDAILEAQRSGEPAPFSLKSLEDRLEHSAALFAEDARAFDLDAFELQSALAAARGDWESVLAAENARRPRLVGLTSFRDEARRRFFLECPTVIDHYRRMITNGPLFADYAECDFDGLQKTLSEQQFGEYTLLTDAEPAPAIAALRRDFASTIELQRAAQSSQETGSSFFLKRAEENRRATVPLLVNLLHRQHRDTADAGVRAEVFELLQWGMLNQTSDAVVRGAAERIAASIDPDLVELTREFSARAQDLSAMPQLIQRIADPTDEEREAQRAEDRQFAEERKNQEEAAERIRTAIAERFPGYFDFIQPRPLSVDDARARLAEDEAIVVIFPAGQKVHILAIDADNLQWHVSDLSNFDLDRRVERLLWDVQAPVDVDEDTHIRWIEDGGEGYPFARGVAYELYRELIEPVSDTVDGKRRLYISAAGSLASLPFGVLVTEPPQGNDGDPQALRDTAWLIDRHALINLPSIASLRLLERLEERDANPIALAGFGDPLLEGKAVTRGVSGRTRNRSVLRSGGVNDPSLPLVERLRKMTRLPGTERELIAIRDALDAPRGAIKLQVAATETAVREADLSKVSILAFATHGVMPAEIEGLAEPGLVLTPPASPSNQDDGLLSASEIAILRLNADWVLLSACNTAVGGNDDTSSLTDAFFFAGARSVLASHWPVSDEAAERLTTLAIIEQRRDPSLSRAEALQRAMRTVRLDASKDGVSRDGSFATWAHPNIWAPFSIYGDIDRPNAR